MRYAGIVVPFLSLTIFAQRPVVVLTDAAEMRASVRQLQRLRNAGMEVAVIPGPGTFIGTLPLGRSESSLASIGTVITTTTSNLATRTLPQRQQMATRYLNALLAGRFDDAAVRAPMDWAHHPEGTNGTATNDVRGVGDAGEDWACTEDHNSEYMLGTVLASTFFVESNGQIDPNLYTWSASMIDDVKLQMIDAWSIWSHTAALNGRTVTAIMDWYEPGGGITSQGYEPVTHTSAQDGLWINAIMHNLGRDESNTGLQLNAFNHDRRNQTGADHAFCTFIACNPPEQGAPNQFTDGKISYAYLGGPYLQLLYKANGWGTNQVNRVYGHEVGHIFHAFDEYAASGSTNCSRSFNGRQNLNFQGGACNGNAACVMVDNSFTGSGADRKWNMCADTPYHLGWTGLLNTPVGLTPVNDVVLASSPVVLQWDRAGAPSGASSYVKVFNRTTDALVYCGNQGLTTSLSLPLVNGQYEWMVTEGNGSPLSGYAGVRGSAMRFSVGAPLNASFSVADGTICAGSTIAVTDATTGGPDTWTWTFAGGSPSTYDGNTPPVISYGTPGTFPITLTVSNASGSSSYTLPNAVMVMGGAVLPISEQFESGVFPPEGWSSTDGSGNADPAFPWTADATGSCNAGISALVQAHSFQGTSASPTLTTPRIDLTSAVAPYMRFRYAYAQESGSTAETLQITGHTCDNSVEVDLLQLGGASLATNGGGYVPNGSWQPTSCGQWREAYVRLDALNGSVAQVDIRLSTSGGQNFWLDDVSIFEGCTLNARVLLQGPYDATTGLMSDTLRALGRIPSSEPYTALGFAFRGEGGNEQLRPGALSTNGPDAIVDWVVVELRDQEDATNIVSSRAALVQRDGDVVDLDGTSSVRLGVLPGRYFVAVEHRNHLGCMTAVPVTLGAQSAMLDLTDPAFTTWGTEARRIGGAKAMLWCGDARGNMDVKYTGQANDRDAVFLRIGGSVPTGVTYGYWSEDVNMDGGVRYTGASNDRDAILQNLNGLPTYVRSQQIP